MPAPKPIPRQGRSKGRWIGDCLASGRKPKIPFCPKRSIGTNGRSRRKSAQVTRTRSISGTEEDGAVRTKPGFNPGERSSGLAGGEATCREACDGRPGTADYFPFFHDCRQGMGNVGTRESSFSDPEAETSAREGSEIECRRDGKGSCQYGPHLSHIVRFALETAMRRGEIRSALWQRLAIVIGLRNPKWLEVGAFVL